MPARSDAPLVVVLLAGCMASGADAPSGSPDAGELQANTCIAAVDARIGTPSAVATGVRPTADGAVVTLTDGTGPWRCVADADGTVTELTFGG